MPTRLFADRRGTDRRLQPRRRSVMSAVPERRRVVDRRLGAERRSTLERRGRQPRSAIFETPGEHVRNALQLVQHLAAQAEANGEAAADLAAVTARLERALNTLEHRPV